jgi:hypothetical protein
MFLFWVTKALVENSKLFEALIYSFVPRTNCKLGSVLFFIKAKIEWTMTALIPIDGISFNSFAWEEMLLQPRPKYRQILILPGSEWTVD